MLQQLLKEKDAEVDDLRNRLMDDAAPPAGGPLLTAEQQTAALAAVAERDVAELRAFIDQHGLMEADPLGAPQRGSGDSCAAGSHTSRQRCLCLAPRVRAAAAFCRPSFADSAI